jgi:apolipoprotein N-acyltransferase
VSNRPEINRRSGADAPRASASTTPQAAARLASRVRAAMGWQRSAIAFAAGVASVLALAPFHAWPVLFATLPVLVWLIDGAGQADTASPGRPAIWYRHPVLRAAASGWWFGFGYFIVGLYWIGEAFIVEAERFLWALPFAVTLLPAGLALFFALATGLTGAMPRTGLARVAVLAIALSATEWLRGHILTGFPWNVLGYALTAPAPLMQSAGVVGIYGLTLVAVIVCGAPLVVLSDRADASGERSRIMTAILIPLLPLLLAWAYGQHRLSGPVAAPVEGVRLRLVQPSIPQREKWRPEYQRRNFGEHLALSRTRPDGTPDDLATITHIVWPEAAMPFQPLASPEAQRSIGEMLGPRSQLIAGALRVEGASPGDRSGRKTFNSLIVFGQEGAPAAIYDKNHLVPFGEYVPLRGLLDRIGLEALTRLQGGFAAGPSPRRPMRITGLPRVGALICYEAIFPGAIVQGVERPGLLVNVTNDGWFGNTIGPRQHLHQARVRAVEEGLPLVRAANNGISAIVDPFGRVLARLDLDVRATIDSALPAELAPPPYARLGDAIWLTMVLLVVMLLAVARSIGRTPPRVGDAAKPPARH